MVLYVESSALVKLVQVEAESAALQRYLRRYRSDPRAAAALAWVEVLRAVAPGGERSLAKARRRLSRCHLIPLDRNLLEKAATVAPGRLRSLDAIHLAAALTVGPELRALVAYDERLLAAADFLGLPTARPT